MSLDARVALRRGALDLDVELHVDDAEIVAVLGPNGAGKTTMLAAMAGIVPLERGAVWLDGEPMEDPARGVRLVPERRRTGVVFQDQLLFPHLSALDNVAFGLRARGWRRREARAEARSLLERVGAADGAERRPGALSGGEAQRVALARALAGDPRLLLLDEPLSAVDAVGRPALRREIGRALRETHGPRILVTHDPVDAMTLASRLVILESGRVTQQGSPDEVRRRPRSRYAADLVGVNLFRGRAAGGVVDLGGATLVAPGAPAGDVFAVIHPHAVALHRHVPEGTPRNVWRGSAGAVDLLGDRARVEFRGPVPLVAEVTPTSVSDLRLAEGGDLWATVKATEVVVYPA